MKTKNGELVISLLFIVLLIAGAVLVSVTGPKDDIFRGISDKTTELSIINIEGISEKITEPVNESGLKIPHTIERYELSTLDTQKMREMLKNGEKIPVVIDGASYTMNLGRMRVNAPDVVSQTFSFTGNLDNAKKSEIVLTISENTLIARINVNGINYIIESTPEKSESGRVIHFSYRSVDVIDEGKSFLENRIDRIKYSVLRMISN
ncbi:hypothetical protein J2128_001514 [Methanomicrobium sp. W14]|uniref:hypothetical protein n=1 Tax=Methanomicrobium sp. W14 TaxID=2817839 RepID=UPI001AEA39B2|nr:hypothetical protein [Methanomicrobium sp. W14]MBP2133560.1 hypothetical protein [Methanomicrobium sp. W14]